MTDNAPDLKIGQPSIEQDAAHTPVPCQHLRFTARANVHRHVDDSDPSRLVHPVSFKLEVGIVCANCNRPFVFDDGSISRELSIAPMPSAMHGS